MPDMATKEAGPLLVQSWRAVLGQHARTWAALERELHAQHGLGASEFEVLDRLRESDQHCGRVQELADASHLSQSALSRVIGRLEQEGLVSRGMCPDDRRGIKVVLTEAGKARHAEAAPTHRAVLAATLAN